MKISNADGVEFEQAVTVPTGTLDGHAINKGQAGAAYMPINQMGIPIPVTADWATGTNMLDDVQDVLGVAEGQGITFVIFAPSFRFYGELHDDGGGPYLGITVYFGTFPTSGVAYLFPVNLFEP